MDLLRKRYTGRGALTTAVLDEIAAGAAHGYPELRHVEQLVLGGGFRELSLSSGERLVYAGLLRNLGSGEASCVTAAQAHDGIVVTDDRTSRSVCADMQLSVTGTIGILVAICREHVITPEEADGILEAMIAKGFYSPVGRISDIL